MRTTGSDEGGTSALITALVAVALSTVGLSVAGARASDSQSKASRVEKIVIGADVIASPKPPARLVQVDECLLYKCGDGDKYITKVPLELYAAPSAASEKRGSIPPGTEIEPINAARITLRPEILRVTQAWFDKGGYQFIEGDLIYLYTGWREWCTAVWATGYLHGHFREENRPAVTHCIDMKPSEGKTQTIQQGEGESWWKAREFIGWFRHRDSDLEPIGIEVPATLRSERGRADAPSLLVAFSCAAIVWVIGLIVLKAVGPKTIAAKISIDSLVGIASSVALYALGIRDGVTLASVAVFGGLLVFTINAFSS